VWSNRGSGLLRRSTAPGRRDETTGRRGRMAGAEPAHGGIRRRRKIKKRVEIDAVRGGQPEQGTESRHVALCCVRARAGGWFFPVPTLNVATRERRRDGMDTGLREAGDWRQDRREKGSKLFSCAAHMLTSNQFDVPGQMAIRASCCFQLHMFTETERQGMELCDGGSSREPVRMSS
jgi:hypothetical protein